MGEHFGLSTSHFILTSNGTLTGRCFAPLKSVVYMEGGLTDERETELIAVRFTLPADRKNNNRQPRARERVVMHNTFTDNFSATPSGRDCIPDY